MMNTMVIHTDGGARGNPGPAAIGIVFEMDNWASTFNQYIGETTNNLAEYTAVLEALKQIPKLEAQHQLMAHRLEFFLDSQLVVRQLNGTYRVKDSRLQKVHREISQHLQQMEIPYCFQYIPRSGNDQADRLVNQALNQHLKK